MTEKEIRVTAKLNISNIKDEETEVEDHGVVENRCSNCNQIINLDEAITDSDCPDNAYCSQKCAIIGEL